MNDYYSEKLSEKINIQNRTKINIKWRARSARLTRPSIIII